jgi:hypothetical protein
MFTWYYFEDAFPVVALELKMDRSQALAAAKTIRSQSPGLNFKPAVTNATSEGAYFETASFKLDATTQAFVELQGGGNQAFSDMLRGDLFAPYIWIVRHFRPHEPSESSIMFTPSGVPYGFATKIPESQLGANLTQGAALKVALEAVAGSAFHPLIGDLNGSTTAYNLVEQSVEVQPNGRADHSFQFERKVQLQEGRYRVLLQVKGDVLATVQHVFKVPESFKRQFSGMRSGNEAIAQVAWIAIAGGYGLLGIGMAIFHLLRRKALLAMSALRWALGVACLATAATLCDFPLTWIQYKTSVRYTYCSAYCTPYSM